MLNVTDPKHFLICQNRCSISVVLEYMAADRRKNRIMNFVRFWINLLNSGPARKIRIEIQSFCVRILGIVRTTRCEFNCEQIFFTIHMLIFIENYENTLNKMVLFLTNLQLFQMKIHIIDALEGKMRLKWYWDQTSLWKIKMPSFIMIHFLFAKNSRTNWKFHFSFLNISFFQFVTVF